MHTLTSQIEHHDSATMQMQHHPQQMQTHQEPVDHQGSITALEALSPSRQLGDQHQEQQVIGTLTELQQQKTSRDTSVLHLIQQQAEHPQLHPLQPSHNSASMDSTSSDLIACGGGEQHQQIAHHQHAQAIVAEEGSMRTARNSNLLRQRHQMDGLDHGGPTARWLLDNYEVADGESLPRSTVYNHYLARCRQTQQAPVNAASFGKLIRSVFVGLRTRRLGTRGHSKYHYFGVRSKQHIHAEMLEHHESGAGCSHELANNENSSHNTDNGSESDSTGNECGRLSATSSSCKRARRSHTGGTSNGCTNRTAQHGNDQMSFHQQNGDHHGVSAEQQAETIYYNGIGVNHQAMIETNNHSGAKIDDCTIPMLPIEQTTSNYELTDLRNHLGANWTTLVDEHWPQREPFQLERQLLKLPSSNDLADNLQVFEVQYKFYYKQMVELLSELKFADVEQLWREFWHPMPQDQWLVQTQNDRNAANQSNGHQQHQHQPQLTFHHLYHLTSQSLVIERINEIDFRLYEAIESFLLPDMLNPIPRPLAQHIRLFAKNIGPWIEEAVKDYSVQFANEKSKSARAFGSALRRYTSLNHLSTASRAIWEKRSALAQMSMDLSRVDLRDIEHQVSLMSRYNVGNVSGNSTNALDLLNASSVKINNAMIAPDIPKHQQPSISMKATDKQMVDTINEICNQTSNNQQHNHNHNQSHHLCAMQPGQLIQNFLHLLEDPYPANSWPDWCRNLVESRVCGLSMEEAINFVLKWNFYISLIMKELTLRSAPSFGSFQLIRLLFDEYIFYLVVTRVAQAQHKTPAQLLSS